MPLLDRFITLAAKRPNIVAIGTEGASNNPATPPDAWTDLDITLFATHPETEAGDWWLTQFGQPTLVQRLANDGVFTSSDVTWHTWLARYPGTQRIDLKITAASEQPVYEAANSLNALQWTRAAGRLSPRATSAASHWVPLPDQAAFTAHVIEFYWCAGNVVKGLSRGNPLYANEQFAQLVHPELLQLLTWQAAAARPHFDAGVSSKFLWPTLTPEQQARLTSTYRLDSLAATRRALQTALALYAEVLPVLAKRLTLTLPPLQAAQNQLHDWLA